MPDVRYVKGTGLVTFDNDIFLYETKGRAEGYTINKLFKKALFSYKRAVWVAGNYASTETLAISSEIWSKLRQKIIENATPYSQVPPRLIFDEDVNKISFIKPRMIKASMPEKMRYFMCPNGHINVCENTTQLAKCKICKNSNLFQVPIFIKKYTNPFQPDTSLSADDPHGIYTDIDAKGYYIPKEGRKECPKCGTERNLKSSNPNFPLKSLYWECPSCKTRNFFTKPSGKQNLFYFRVDAPFENLFLALSTRLSVPKDVRSLEDAKKISSLTMNHLNDVKYANQMTVYDSCYGAITGKKFFHFKENYKIAVYMREFNTKGLIFQFDDKLYGETRSVLEKNVKHITNPDARTKVEYYLKNENEMRITILHTFKHMILFKLPMLIGIEPSKISGDYSTQENAVYIFDNESGGIGVCETIKNDLSRFAKLFLEVVEKVKNCKRDPHCNGACKLCSFIENCGNINHNLNRYLLFPMFKIDFKELEETA